MILLKICSLILLLLVGHMVWVAASDRRLIEKLMRHSGADSLNLRDWFRCKFRQCRAKWPGGKQCMRD